MKKDEVLSEWDESQTKLEDRKQAKKLIWRTRFSIGFTVIRTLLLLLLAYVLYVFTLEVFYSMSGKQAAFDRMATTLVETRTPGITIEKQGIARDAAITPFLTQQSTYSVYRQVGDWKVSAGEVTVKKRLFGKVQYHLDEQKKYLDDEFTDNFPVSPDLLGKTSDAKEQSGFSLTEQLANVEDGFVAQVKVGVKNGMTPEKLRQLLTKYDLEINQMAVYSGEITNYDVSYSQAGQFTFISPLILRPAHEYDEENRLSSWRFSLTDKQSLAEAEKQLVQDLDWLTGHGSYYGRKVDQKRMEYLEENGIQVIGAVVTGPVREMEKLEQEEQLYQFQLGGIEVWNWSK
ncbi:anti sigma factor C-terminal domain-containing protein [Sediminibacillus terrae]|uniref:anti sigma factor C-terminal domain-containing protein n=1 Tax=Sediminibacillus terrae TaxID=1562106 RepID=UPI00129602D2|nr:anti sigma factor C-terminal domain-containing protein [Sediminibacillus terrae]